MSALPPIPPTLDWVHQIRLGQDYHVRVDTNDYSVKPTTIGRQVRGDPPTWSGCKCATTALS